MTRGILKVLEDIADSIALAKESVAKNPKQLKPMQKKEIILNRGFTRGCPPIEGDCVF